MFMPHQVSHTYYNYLDYNTDAEIKIMYTRKKQTYTQNLLYSYAMIWLLGYITVP